MILAGADGQMSEKSLAVGGNEWGGLTVLLYVNGVYAVGVER